MKQVRGLIEGLKGLLPDRWHTDLQYLWRHGRLRNHTNPRTFHELLIKKKVNDWDRVKELGPLADKYAVREHVREVVGGEYLVPLLETFNSAQEIDLTKLPDSFVLKGTHGSGMNAIVKDKRLLSEAELRREAQAWLVTDYAKLFREAPYRAAVPRLIAETLLIGDDGQPPTDYKFFVFDGHVALFEADYSRFLEHQQAFFLPDGRRLAVHRGRPKPEPIPSLPQNLDHMVAVAAELGVGHEFVRVDLYEVGGRVYFGELTFYPAGALNLWNPEAFENEMGEVWLARRPIGEEWVASLGLSSS